MNATLWRLVGRLADGRAHRLEVLGEALQLKPDQLLVALGQLVEFGLEPQIDQGQCQLPSALELLNAESILRQLQPDIAAQLDLKLETSIDSTNHQLQQMALAGARSATVLLAEHQRAGRGRNGRTWQSPFGVNLYCSLLWHFACPAKQLGGLSLAVGVAVCQALDAFGINQVRLKWPNDLVVENKKLGGILIQLENVQLDGASDGCNAVIGIGINCKMPAVAAQSIDQPWVDLASLPATAQPSRNQLAASVINQCVVALQRFVDDGLAAFTEQWQRLDALANQPIDVAIGDQKLAAKALGIDAQGLLRCQMPDGQLRSFSGGEVSVRRSSV